MRLAAISVLLMAMSSVTSAQTLKHFPIAPLYKDQKVLNHLGDLENRLKAVRETAQKISFSGWSNPDIQAAAEKHSNLGLQQIEKAVSTIEDIRAAGTYSIRGLFMVYEGAQIIDRTYESIASELFVYKDDGQLGAEILAADGDLFFSTSNLEMDIEVALDFQADELMTLQTQPPCK